MMKYVVFGLIFAIASEVLFMFVFYPEENLRDFFIREQNALSSDLSRSKQLFVAGFAGAAEKMIIHDSGLSKGVRAVFLPSDAQMKNSGDLAEMGHGMFATISGRFSLMSELFYEYMLRLGTVAAFWKLWISLLAVSVLSGILKRRIRQNTFGKTSSLRQALAVRGLFTVCYVLLLAALSPLIFGVVPMVVAMCLVSFFLGTAVTNFHKRI
jgi:hypothetical protein